MAGYLDIWLNAGEDFNQSVTLTDINGSYLNLSSYVVASSMKKSYYTSNVAATFNTTVANSQTGLVNLELSYSNTANISPGRYVYDVIIRNTSSNTAQRVLEGIVYVTPAVTPSP